MRSNWISEPTNRMPEPSLADKVKALLRIHYKLVLCQVHELERIKVSNCKDLARTYVEGLYEHYIVKELPKTYLV